MNVLLILNEAAGSLNGERDAVAPDDVAAEFRRHGITPGIACAPAGKLASTLRRAVAERPDAIVVGGGDGTISTAADCLAGTDIALGVLPLGTLNHFARDLGLSAGWREAVAELAAGVVRAVDVGEVNGRTFINNCSLGSYPEAVRRRDALRRERGAGKWWAMTLASFEVFRRLRRMRLRVETDTGTYRFRAPFLVVANNRYSGRVLDDSLRPRLDAGQLWIYTTRVTRRLTLLRLVWEALVHDLDASAALERFETMRATITSERRPIPVAIDGELAAIEAPLRFSIRRGALRVLVPPRLVEETAREPAHQGTAG